jgi:pimeloyl-ACP methyl ester carboxylesterase
MLLAGTILVLAYVLLFYSPGTVGQYVDSKGNILQGSISEKTFVTIGGVKQGMFIQGKNLNNPVLLYLHGGPSFPNYFLIDRYKPGLEDYFTVCYWEQRGGGLSYSPEVAPESMTFSQLVSDAVEVTNYLRQRFGQQKIYLFAHSGGSVIGLLAIQKHPELFHAYISMAQITNQMESEKIAYSYMMNAYLSKGDQKSVTKLKNFNPPENLDDVVTFFNSAIRDKSMHELGIGTMHNMKSIFWDIFVPVCTCRAYTLREKINIWKSKIFFLPKTNLSRELLAINFFESARQIDIPVYFLCGQFDYTVNSELTKSYFEQLEAPEKKFYLFENSAHSPLFEETEKVRRIMEGLRNEITPTSD